MDKRHARRIEIVQKLFPLGFEGISPTSIGNDDPLARDIINKLDRIDKIIQTYAPRYPLKKIAKIDLSILRLSLYELLIERKQPPKVVIDEAVTLAKEFGNDKSYSFVNGVLGSALKHLENHETT